MQNYLAILASLIDLQISELEDEAARDALVSISSRVHAMAKAYEMLLPATGGGPTDLCEYLSAVLAGGSGLRGG